MPTDTTAESIDYFWAVWKRKWVVALFTLATLLGSYVVGQLLPKTYSAQTLVLIAPPHTAGHKLGMDPLTMDAYHRIAESPALLEKIILNLDLKEENGKKMHVESLREIISINGPKNEIHSSERGKAATGIITINAVGEDPKQITAITNSWADILTKESRNIRSHEASLIHEKILEHYNLARAKMKKIETDLKATKSNTQMSLLQQELSNRKARLAVNQIKYGVINMKLKERKIVHSTSRYQKLKEIKASNNELMKKEKATDELMKKEKAADELMKKAKDSADELMKAYELIKKEKATDELMKKEKAAIVKIIKTKDSADIKWDAINYLYGKYAQTENTQLDLMKFELAKQQFALAKQQIASVIQESALADALAKQEFALTKQEFVLANVLAKQEFALAEKMDSVQFITSSKKNGTQSPIRIDSSSTSDGKTKELQSTNQPTNQIFKASVSVPEEHINEEIKELYKITIQNEEVELAKLEDTYLRNTALIQQLSWDLSVQAGLLAKLANKAEEARMLVSEKTTDIRFVAEAIEPHFPVGPNIQKIVVFGTMIGFFLSIFLCIFSEFVVATEIREKNRTIDV